MKKKVVASIAVTFFICVLSKKVKIIRKKSMMKKIMKNEKELS